MKNALAILLLLCFATAAQSQTNEKFVLGKISRNEILQLQLEQLKAQKALATAKRDLEISTLNLKAYIGLQNGDLLELVAPQPGPQPAISPETALADARPPRYHMYRARFGIAFGR